MEKWNPFETDYAQGDNRYWGVPWVCERSSLQKYEEKSSYHIREEWAA